jgi:hypothetical protein
MFIPPQYVPVVYPSLLHDIIRNLNYYELYQKYLNPLTAVTSLGVKDFRLLNTPINIRHYLRALRNQLNLTYKCVTGGLRVTNYKFRIYI